MEGAEITGAVLVVGGGIAGTQAALDLADSGFKVYLVDSTTGIGGVMAQLDKTFPTNDCSMCILSPKLVMAGRHPDIHVMTGITLDRVEGRAGDFTVGFKKRAFHVDEDACVGCGECAQYCPVESIDPFNEGLIAGKSISVKYPQAVPLKFAINRDTCIGCGVCENVCKAGAILYQQEDDFGSMRVGAIILAPGFDEHVPGKNNPYGYGVYPNVVTSIEFERILSASGPTGGMVLRPSDGDIPEKVAFIQCVGSRDKKLGIEYCSSVCCMYTCKEAVIAHEHQHQVHPTIFSMDVRAFGKDFDKYIARAQEEYGVRYIRHRVGMVQEDPRNQDLIITYEDASGDVIDEHFNMVVLSQGLRPPESTRDLARVTGVSLNDFSFCSTRPFMPVETSRQGTFACGAFSSPKDIPDSVTEASAAAALVNVMLSSKRGSLISTKEMPPEKDISWQEPRIGVFVCYCGINIGGVVDVPRVVEYARSLPNVVYVTSNLYTCSADTQGLIKQDIEEQGLNRVVVASCTPRTHEPMFQATVRDAALNPYLFEMANIRDQCSWVHMNQPQEATRKAMDLVRMAVVKARKARPLQRILFDVVKKALVIGGGIAGMNAALGFARQGIETFLVERSGVLGGQARLVRKLPGGHDVSPYLEETMEAVRATSGIHVFTNATVETIQGHVGNFKTRVSWQEKERVLDHGVVVIATGSPEHVPSTHGYGAIPGVVTQREFEAVLDSGDLEGLNHVAMIQCVGSRDEKHPYCSKYCCSEAIQNAIDFLQLNPGGNVVIMYRDIRTFGFNEMHYTKARELGVTFLRYDPSSPPVVEHRNGSPVVSVEAPVLGHVSFDVDRVVLSTGMEPRREDNEVLAKMLKIPLNGDGFFLEAHAKLRPVEFATEGVFLCGSAHSPRTIPDSITQAMACVARAMTILSKEKVEAEPIIAKVDPYLCIGCNKCADTCSYNAVGLDEASDIPVSRVEPSSCKGCGSCVSACPAHAITVNHFGDEHVMPMVREAIASPDDVQPKIIAFLCNWCSYAGADNAGVARMQYPPEIRPIRVMCSGRVDPEFILKAFLGGADGVLVTGCHIGDCHYMDGNRNTRDRVGSLTGVLQDLGIERERLGLEWVSAGEGEKFATVMRRFVETVRELGPLRGRGTLPVGGQGTEVELNS